MFRYLAMSWDRKVERAAEAAARIHQRMLRQYPTWSRALDRPGILVLCDARESRSDHTIIPVGERGVILGTLFRRQPLSATPRVDALDPGDVDRVERTRGRCLTDTHWGSYVLILSEGETGEAHILRGPLSSLACYYTAHGDVHLCFSRADDVLALSLLHFSINWPRVRAQVTMSAYLNGETGLDGVRALDAGSCLSVLGSKQRLSSYWSPSASRWQGDLTDFPEAAHALRTVALACVGSWATCHDSTLTMLSGGLDSSVVLACLARAPTRPRLACVNFHSPLLGDERGFARCMAGRVGADLIECDRDPDLDLRIVLRCNRTVSPVLHFTGFDSEPAVVRLANDLGATAIFKGELGDNLFGSGVRHEVLIEYVKRYGLRPSLLGVAVDYALLRRVSVWHALRLAIRHGLPRFHRRAANHHGRSPNEEPRRSPESGLATAEAIEASEAIASRFVHPWSCEAGLPAGTWQLVQGLQIITSTSYESPFTAPDDPPILSPLASQPLVELALAIPTHFHIHGGQNRALARAAFAADLPDAVLHRGSGKGGPELWLRALAERNRSFLEELLLDGVLVREKLLNRGKVELLLSGRLHRNVPTFTELIAQIYIEAWLQQWRRCEQCLAT